MTISDIDKTLSAQLPGPLTLSAGVFGQDSGLTPLFQQYFPAPYTITIANPAGYQFDANLGTITFNGDGSGGPFDQMQIISVVIKMDGDNPLLSISAIAPDGWTLYPRFPDIRAPLVQSLPFKSPELDWANYDSDTDDTMSGFYFAGTIDLSTPPLNVLSPLLGNIDPPVLWGQIEFNGTSPTETKTGVFQYVPDFLFVMDESQEEVSLGPFKLSGPVIKLFGNSFFNTYDKYWQVDSYVQVSSMLQFNSTWIKLQAQINDIHNDIIFELIVNKSLGAPLTALASFVGLDVKSLGVPGFSLPDDILLKDLSVRLDPSAAQTIQSVTLEIGMDSGIKWTLWDNIFLGNVELAFFFVPGGDEGLSGSVSGLISEWLQVQADFSTAGDYTFYGSLTEKDASISDAIAFLTNNSITDLPAMNIDELDFSASFSTDPNNKSYSLDCTATLAGDWVIISLPGDKVKIALVGLLFTISHNDSSTSIVAGASFQIAAYSVGIKGTYATDEGWAFDGSMTLNKNSQQQLSLDSIAAEIDTMFSIQPDGSNDLPSFLGGWFVESLDISFATLNKDFKFVLEIANGDVSPLDLFFAIQLLHGDNSFTREFTARAVIKTDRFDMEFDLSIKETTVTSPETSKTFEFTGTYNATTPPTLSDFIAFVADKLGAHGSLPAELNIDAAAKAFAVKVIEKDNEATVIQLAGEFELDSWEVYFAYTNDTSLKESTPQGTPLPYVFGLAVSGLLDLSNLPLIGRIPGIDALKIDKLGFYYTNATIPSGATLSFSVPALSAPNQLAPDPTAATLSNSGFSLIAVFGNHDSNSSTSANKDGSTPLSPGATMTVPTIPAAAAPGSAFAAAASTPTDPISWLDVNKTFGPFSFQKIGLSYTGPNDPATQLGIVSVYLDGSFQIAGLGMALQNLGVSFHLPKPGSGSFDPATDIDFHLGGLYMNYQGPDFDIAGGFITLPGPGTNFIGDFMVSMGQFNLQAYGGFSNGLSDPSLFIFLHLDYPLGGPPFFFINGLSGGFGVNRAFNLPTFDQLLTYPLLPANSTIPTAAELSATQDRLSSLTTALTSLSQYLPVQQGEYWLAAGLDVSSFDMIKVSAVISFAFGVNFRIGLVGTAEMSLPVNEPYPIAYIQIDFEVTFSPSDGLIAANGQITPASYIYADFVHLTGGFAFYTWFSGPNQGDFVMTIGGYNPHYLKPSNYPDVPRLQIKFSMDSLDVTGQSYFALTPKVMMGGIDVHATWSSGPLDAWFDAGLDVLINWKPFHYEADGYIDIGISLDIDLLFCTVRITVHAGVDLLIWGPEFGGRATVDLSIVSFTIYFGATQVIKTVNWQEFQNFLPSVDGDNTTKIAAFDETGKNRPLTNISVNKGLLKQFSSGEDPDGLDWLIDPNGFEFITQSGAPCTSAIFNTETPGTLLDPAHLDDDVRKAIDDKATAPFFAYSGPDWSKLTFGVVPMGLQDIHSTHTVSVQTWNDASTQYDIPTQELIVVLQTGGYPVALWGNSGTAAPDLQGDVLMKDALAGLSIRPMIWFPRRTTYILYYYLVFQTNNLPLTEAPPPQINDAAFSNADTILKSLDSGDGFSSTTGVRKSIVSLLQNNGYPDLALLDDTGLNTAQYTAYPFFGYMSHTAETQFNTLN